MAGKASVSKYSKGAKKAIIAKGAQASTKKSPTVAMASRSATSPSEKKAFSKVKDLAMKERAAAEAAKKKKAVKPKVKMVWKNVRGTMKKVPAS